jgi:FkbM family methyltransferase
MTMVASQSWEPFSTRLWRFLHRRPRITAIERDGLSILSDGRDEMAVTSLDRSYRYSHGIRRRIAKLLRRYEVGSVPLRSGDHVINVGANIGEMSLGLARKGCNVIAVEPDPTTLRCLTENVRGAAEVLPMGLWDIDGELTFFQKPESADTSAINEVGDAVSLPVSRLDTIMANRPERIRLLIGDAEGGEPEVLRGAFDTLPRIDFIRLDCGRERHGESTFEECRRIVEQAGFEVSAPTKKMLLVARNLRA